MTVQIIKSTTAVDEYGFNTTFESPFNPASPNLAINSSNNTGLLFRRIGINKDVEPDSVELAITITYKAGTGAGMRIYGIAADSPRDWRYGVNETDKVAPADPYVPLTTAYVDVSISTTVGPVTFDVTAIFTEIFARSGWKPGYNVGLVLVGSSDTGDDYKVFTPLTATLTFTLDSLPTATAYRIDGNLAGQAFVLSDDSLLVYNTLQGLVNLQSQPLLLSPNGDADGVTVTFDTSEGGTFSPTSHTFVGSEPAVFYYTPTTTPIKHYLGGTNDGGLTDPDDVLFIVRKEHLFPSTAVWYQPCDEMPLDTTGLHARFSDYSASKLTIFAGTMYNGHIIDQCINYREGDATRVDFDAYLYSDEGDPVLPDGKLPMGENIIIEGYPYVGGDTHCLLYDIDNEVLHESFSTQPDGGGYKGFHAQWDVTSLAIRTPLGRTSAAADGRPITPFVLTYDEAKKAVDTNGVVPHALRFTIPLTAFQQYIWDASHSTSNGGSGSPMYGTRMRLKASFDISGFSPINQAVLRTLKKYGMYMQDGGLSWYVSAENDHRWDTFGFSEFNAISPYTDFETVDTSAYMLAEDSYEAHLGMAAEPATVPCHYDSITLTLTGGGDVSWDGTTVFSVSGVSGVTKLSQSIVGERSATITIATISAAGTLTITESITGDHTCNVTIAAEVEGANVGTLLITDPFDRQGEVTVDIATISVSPTSGRTDQTPRTLTITGTNTVFTQEDPDTLLSVDYGSLGTPTINSDTEIVVDLSGGGYQTITITENGPGATDTYGQAAATAFYARPSPTARASINVAKTFTVWANGSTTATVTGHVNADGTFAGTVALAGTTEKTLSLTMTDFASSPYTVTFTDSASLTDPSAITLTVTEFPDNTGGMGSARGHRLFRP